MTRQWDNAKDYRGGAGEITFAWWEPCVCTRVRGAAVAGFFVEMAEADEIDLADLEGVCRIVNNRPILKPKFYLVMMQPAAVRA